MAEERYGEFKTNAIGEVRVKKEEEDDSLQASHSHKFYVKLSIKDQREYTIQCNQPRTVLEALKLSEKYNEQKYKDDNIIIQLSKRNKEFIVATHFPCSCIEDGESLIIISGKSEKVEEAQGHNHTTIYPRNKYSVFYIETMGGHQTKTKKLFRSSAVKDYKYLCVYGEKGMTVEEAVKNDGRFIDFIEFTLSDNEDPNVVTEHTQIVDSLDLKKFKLCLPQKMKVKTDKPDPGSPGASKNSQRKRDPVPSSDVAQQSGIRVITTVEKRHSDNTDEIYTLLQDQFPGLKKWMESRFPGDSFLEELKLRKENFGKIQASFSEVHRVRKLIKLGESVCKVNGENVCQGTGFVLFDNIILTNAHLFTMCGFPTNIWMKQLNENVTAVFNCEDPGAPENCNSFKVVKILDLTYDELDYVILELDLDAESQNQIPPGLLKIFGPMPLNGEACIIGHPNEEVKQMDPTCIIGKQIREQNIKGNIHPFIAHKIINTLKAQDIESILIGGKKAEKRATYNTFMRDGSSGSPVFDGSGKVFGLHTGGFVYEHLNQKKSVIEYAQPLDTILNNFVSKLKEKRNEDLLKRIEEEANGNLHLEMICGLRSWEEHMVEPADSVERSDDEPMQTD